MKKVVLVIAFAMISMGGIFAQSVESFEYEGMNCSNSCKEYRVEFSNGHEYLIQYCSSDEYWYYGCKAFGDRIGETREEAIQWLRDEKIN